MPELHDPTDFLADSADVIADCEGSYDSASWAEDGSHEQGDEMSGDYYAASSTPCGCLFCEMIRLGVEFGEGFGRPCGERWESIMGAAAEGWLPYVGTLWRVDLTGLSRLLANPTPPSVWNPHPPLEVYTPGWEPSTRVSLRLVPWRDLLPARSPWAVDFDGDLDPARQ